MEKYVREKSGGMKGHRALSFSLNGFCWPYSPGAFCSAGILSHCSWCYPKQCLFSGTEWWREKRQSWSLLSRLSSSSLEFIPENCTSCIVMFLYGIKDLQLCIRLFIHQAVVAYLWCARHSARPWGYDVKLDAIVYRLCWEMENSLLE